MQLVMWIRDKQGSLVALYLVLLTTSMRLQEAVLLFRSRLLAHSSCTRILAGGLFGSRAQNLLLTRLCNINTTASHHTQRFLDISRIHDYHDATRRHDDELAHQYRQKALAKTQHNTTTLQHCRIRHTQ